MCLLQGLLARAYETLIVLCLLAIVVLGMTYVMSALLDNEQSNIHTLLSKFQLIFKTYWIVVMYKECPQSKFPTRPTAS